MPDARATPPALLLDRQAVSALLTPAECREAVAQAFAALSSRSDLPGGILDAKGLGGEFHLKAGGLKATRTYFTWKVNSGFFGNRVQNGLPNLQGFILLFDAENGQPLAVMESSEITRQRTAAATAVATDRLARPEASRLALIGAGVQALAQFEAVALVRPVTSVLVWSRDLARARSLAHRIAGKSAIPAQAAPDVGEACRASDIIITSTPSRNWLLGSGMVPRGAFVAAVGADSEDKQELQPELMAESLVVTDLTRQCEAVGDLHHAIAAGKMRAADVHAELGEIVTGARPGRTHADQTFVFDSTGTAAQDAAVTALVYERAAAQNLGTRFPFWG